MPLTRSLCAWRRILWRSSERTAKPGERLARFPYAIYFPRRR